MFGSMGQTNVKNLGNGGTMDGDVTITGDLTVSGGIGLSLSEVIEGTSTIDVTNTEALLVRKNGDGGDVFIVDTTNEQVKVGDNFIVNASGDTPVLTITGTRNDILFTESDTTDLNTLVRQQSGLFRIDTMNDALDNPTRRFTIEHSTGNVSIGSSSPSARLHILGTGELFRLEGANAQLRVDNSTTDTINLNVAGGSDSMTLSTGSTTALTIDSSQNTTLTGNLALSATSPQINFSGSSGDYGTFGYTEGDPDVFKWGLFQNSGQIASITIDAVSEASPSARFRFNVGGDTDSAITIDSSKRVGINKDSPDEKLHVAGNVKLFESGNTADKTYSSTGAGLFLSSYQSDSGSPYTKTSDIVAGSDGTVPSEIRFFTRTSGNANLSNALTIDSSQNATFAGDILVANATPSLSLQDTDGTNQISELLTSGATTYLSLRNASSHGSLVIRGYNGSAYSTALTIGSDQHATFAQNINIGDDKALTLGADSDSQIFNTGSHLFIRNNTSNQDIIFQVNDGGSTQTELMRLDASVPSVNVSGILNVSGAGLKITGANTAHLASSLVLGQDTSALSQIRAYGADDSTAGTLEFRMTSSAGAVNQGVMKLDVNSRISLTNNDSGGTGGSDGTSANTIFGYLAGQDIASGGVDNTYFGHKAGSNNATGDDNTFVGSNAGKGSHGNSNSSNVGIGSDALLAVSTGSYNAVIGNASAKAMTDGHNNIAIGNQALMTSTSTGICVAIGDDAMKNGDVTSSADGTVAIGGSALLSLTSGAGSVVIGYNAGDAITSGDFNTAIGYEALTAETTGDRNTAVGFRSLQSANGTNNASNTAVGFESGNAISNGIHNVAIGSKAGNAITTGDYNVMIGGESDPSGSNAQNQIAIGYGATGTGDNVAVIGNTAITDVLMAQDGEATIHCSGVKFPPTQQDDANVNTLDDYEEGDYNATITPNTSGTVTLNSSIDRLVYTKIGRQVTIVGEIGVSSVSSPVGNFKISLPFAVGDFTDSGGRASGSIVVSGSVSANVSDFLIKCFEGESFARVWLGDATSLQNDASEQLQASTTISIGLTYFV